MKRRKRRDARGGKKGGRGKGRQEGGGIEVSKREAAGGAAQGLR